MTPRKGPWLAREWLPIVLFLGLALVPLLGLFMRDDYLLSLLTRVMVLALAVVALDLILGYGGLVSFGHAAFLGFGAYATGILITHGYGDALIALPVAMLASGLFALVTGAISLRTRGVYFIMITLAFGQMAFFTATSLAAYGGDDGLTLWSRATVFGFPLLKSDRALYVATLLALLLGYITARAIVASRFGRVLTASRDNPARVQALGFNPYPYQLAVYVVAGMMTGAAGFLLANQAEFVSPAYMSWQRSGELLVMVILGGIGSLHGAIVGAAAFLLLEAWLPGLLEQVSPAIKEHWKLVFGPLLVIIVLFARGGIMGLLRGRHG